MDKLAGIAVIGAVVIGIGVGIFKGLAFVGGAAATGLAAVDWGAVFTAVGEIVRALVIAVLVFAGVILGLIWVAIAVYCILEKRAEAKLKEEERIHREISKPRIPETLSYRESEGVRNYNAVIRPDLQDLEKFRDSD